MKRIATALAITLNEKIAREESEQILSIWNAGREKLLQGDGFGGAQFTASFTVIRSQRITPGSE